MIKYFCDICKRQVDAVAGRLIRTGVPTPGILDEAHSQSMMDVCWDCAGTIEAAVIAAEVEAYESIVAACASEPDEPSAESEVNEDDGV